MNFSNYYNNLFKRIYVNNSVKDSVYTKRALSTLDSLERTFINSRKEIPQEHMNKESLYITEPRGNIVGRCPGSKGHVCCNYITVDLYLGCTLGCSYCIMKSYLNFAPITVYADPNPGINAIKKIAEENPEKTIRVGTGEVGDSLQLDPLFGIAEDYIKALSSYENVYFESKTKTDFVDHLLDIKEKGNAVIGFSLNPEKMIEEEEACAMSLKQRFEAAKKAVDSGFNIAFHFDPIYSFKGWQDYYFKVIEEFKNFPEDKVSWISLGTFRYTAGLKDKIEDRPYLYNEFVPCKDNKFRYMQKVRSDIYTEMLSEIRKYLNSPVYMCMESNVMWNKVFSALPLKVRGLDGIFNRPKDVASHPEKREQT